MLNCVHNNPGTKDASNYVKNGTHNRENVADFSIIYKRMNELRTGTLNKSVCSIAVPPMEAPTSHTSVYAPGNGNVFAPRLVDLSDPKATLHKLEELQKDIKEKGLSGFFDGMNDDESFAYVYERYADVFGADFLDHQWQHLVMRRVPNESDIAKGKVTRAFSADVHCAFMKSSDWNNKNIDPKHNLSNRVDEAFVNYFGYGSLAPHERYQAILSDYNAAGDTTYAASFKLFWLLGRTGAIDKDMMNDAISLLDNKMRGEYAALDMTVTDMTKSRYANAFYGFDAAAYLLGMVDYMQHAKETSIVFNYDPRTIAFFEKLAADLQALGGLMG